MPYANPDDRRAQARRYYAANKEKVKASVVAWRQKNPAKAKEVAAKAYKKWAAKTIRVRDPAKMAMYSEKWRRLNPERVRDVRRKSDLRRHYKISVTDYEAMLKKQAGVCAICKHPEPKRRLGVDHDHATGQIRGLLCTGCNTMLGGAQDTTRLLLAGVDYLIKHGSQPGLLREVG